MPIPNIKNGMTRFNVMKGNERNAQNPQPIIRENAMDPNPANVKNGCVQLKDNESY